MDPITAGLATNGLSALAEKVASKIHQRYALTFRMRRSQKAATSSKARTQILDALERVIGSSSGLTPATNQSLLDIANSGLLEHLISIFGSDSPDIDAKRLITYIHISRGSNSEEDSIRFADDLAKCLSAVSDDTFEKASVGFPPEILDRHKKLFVDRAKRSAAILNTIAAGLIDKDGSWVVGKELDPQTVSQKISDHFDPLKTYANATLQFLNTVDVHGSAGDVVKVDLDKIYVDVPVSFIPREKNFVGYQDLRKYLPRTEVATSWDQTLEFISKTVLLGDPGGGKSTLSKKICSEISKAFLSGQSTLPIFIQLRTYIAKAADDERLSLTHYILDSINATILDPDDTPLDSSVLYHLRVGAAFVVADGLDEVLTPSNRARVVDELQRFSRDFPLVPLLVTSRYVGYETQPLNGFNHLGVDHLDESAIQEIYKNVSCSVLKKDYVEVQESLPVFLADAHRKADELIRSPLLLTLIVIIYSKKSEIPDNRASLYGFCADLLFERWDGYRNIVPGLPERYRLFDLFKHLSSILYEREEYGGRINKDDLLDEAREFFRKDYIDNREGKSAEAARHMVDHLTGRAWILHEVGERIFEFTHRTFLEFFYARHLESVYEGTSELISECLQHVRFGSRTVPAHLALQIRTKDKRVAATTVCNALKEAISNDTQNSELTDFCLDSLGYLLPDAESMLSFVTELAPAVLSHDNPTGPVRLLCNDSPMRASILEGTLPSLQDVKRVDEVSILYPALLRMHKDNSGILSRRSGSELDLCSMIVEQTYSKQSHSPFLCKLAFDLDARVNWTALEKFGFRIWKSRNNENITRLFFDAGMMLQSANRKLVDADYEGDKFLSLAALFNKNIGDSSSDRVITDYLPSIYGFEPVNFGDLDVSLTADNWTEDVDSLETFAFSLVFFLEVDAEFLHAKQLVRLRAAYFELVDALEAVNSDKATWYRNWVDKTGPAFVRNRFAHRLQRVFSDASAEVV